MIISPYRKPDLIPPKEHPRLMIVEKDIGRIRENLTDSACALSVSLWQELCQKEIRCVGATPDCGTYDLSEYLSVEAKALRALLSRKSDDAREAIGDVLRLLRESNFEKGNDKYAARWLGN